ncbi:MAG: hypothetical protein WDO71_05085 [Bacteroidota bacterium]
MKNLKIAASAKIKLPVSNYHDGHFIYTWDYEYQNWLFILYVMDELYAPVRNLKTENFTFNFLNSSTQRTDTNSRLLDVVYIAEPVFGTPVSVPVNFSPLPNPSVQASANGYYLARVQQLLQESGTSVVTTNHPAKFIEIIINNITLEVSGNGIFTLL